MSYVLRLVFLIPSEMNIKKICSSDIPRTVTTSMRGNFNSPTHQCNTFSRVVAGKPYFTHFMASTRQLATGEAR